MAYWCASIPAWIAALVLIVVFPLVTICAQAILRRTFPTLEKGSHNDVAGFLVAIIGISYAVVVGFVIVVLWQNFTDAQSDTQTEAVLATSVMDGSSSFGPAVEHRLREQVIAYNAQIVVDWANIARGEATPNVQDRIAAMFTTVNSLKPRTAAQRAFVSQAEGHLLDLSNARRSRILAIGVGGLPGLMWVVILVASGVTITFCLLFGLENARLHYLMVAGVAAVIGTNLFLVVELNYPFAGDLSVQPTSYATVVRNLSEGG